MKQPLLILLFLVLAVIVKAQQPTNAANAANTTTSAEKPDSTNTAPVYSFVEIQPSFRGPLTLGQFIANNIHYPVSAEKNHIQGKVFVQFVVQRDGSVADAVIVRSVSPDIDAEALRVINISRWHPGIQNGRPVSARFTIPITFNLGLPVQKIDTIHTAKTDNPEDELNSAQPKQTPPPNPQMLNQIFSAVEYEPTFPGGSDKLNQYIQEKLANFKYDGAPGKVLVNFVVERDGTLTDIKAVRGISQTADAEAIRIMQYCPKWNPGMQNGNAVRVFYSIAISFNTNN